MTDIETLVLIVLTPVVVILVWNIVVPVTLWLWGRALDYLDRLDS